MSDERYEAKWAVRDMWNAAWIGDTNTPFMASFAPLRTASCWDRGVDYSLWGYGTVDAAGFVSWEAP